MKWFKRTPENDELKKKVTELESVIADLAINLRNNITVVISLKQYLEATLYLLFDTNVISKEAFTNVMRQIEIQVRMTDDVAKSTIVRSIVDDKQRNYTEDEVSELIQQILISKMGEA